MIAWVKSSQGSGDICRWQVISSSAVEGLGEGVAQGEGVVQGGDVVHAVEVGATVGCEQGEGDSGQGAGFGELGVMEDFADEAFAGEGHHEREVVHAQFAQVADEGEVVLGGFAEADAGVQTDALRVDAALLGLCYAPGEEVAHFGDNVLILRGLLHGGGGALHVHEDDAAGLLGAEGSHVGIGQAADVVHDVGAGLQGGCGDGGVAGVDGDAGGGVALPEGGNDGEDAAHFLILGYRGGAGAGGFAADVDDVGPLVQHALGVLLGGGCGGVLPAVGEGVGGDVEYAHDTALWGQLPDFVAQVPEAHGILDFEFWIFNFLS